MDKPSAVVVCKLLVSLLHPTHRKVFFYVNERGETTQYEVSKWMGVSFQVIHHTFKKLRTMGLIHEVRQETKRNKMNKKIFSPTRLGEIVYSNFIRKH